MWQATRTCFHNQLHLSLPMNKLTLCGADIRSAVLCRQTVYLQLSSFHFRPVCWYVSFTPCPGDAGYWVSVCRAVECHRLSMVKLNLLWWLDSKLRHNIDYQRCYGVWFSHGIRRRADVGSWIFLVCLCDGQGVAPYSGSSTGKLAKQFRPRYHRRGISDDLALRELDIFPTLGEQGSSWKRDERPSCAEESWYLSFCSRFIFLLYIRNLSTVDRKSVV